MSDHHCEHCDKTFSTKSNLNTHLKKSKSCGSDSRITYDCSFCSKKFTQKNSLDYHLENSCDEKKESERRKEAEKERETILEKDKLIEEFKKELLDKINTIQTLEENIKNHDKKIKDQDEYYDRLIREETMSKERMRVELRINEKQINDLKKTIEELHEKMLKLASTRPASTVNNINNNTQNITLNMFITPEFVKTQTTKHLTYDHFANGIKGLANFVHDYVLVDKNGKLLYACYDKARHILRYRDDQGNEIDDVDAEKLIAIISQPIKDKYTKICKELREDIERYKGILEDDEESWIVKKEIREKMSKAELSLRVMEFQGDGIQQIGMSNHKELARSLEKVCTIPKVGNNPVKV